MTTIRDIPNNYLFDQHFDLLFILNTNFKAGKGDKIKIAKITVIIPNYNYAHYLDQAIQSVLDQSYQNIEIIVVNNGSTDNSLEVLSNFEGKIQVIDQSNLGQSGARNSGLKNATGDFIAFLDADDYWAPTKLELQAKLINDSTQLVYCGILPFKDLESNIMNAILPKYRGQCMRYFLELPAASVVLSGESTALFSRTLLEKVGNFDTTLNSAAGWDFFRRCSRVTNFNFINEALVYYRIHENNMSHSRESVILDIRYAYLKIFTDKDWKISEKEESRILISLEFSFLKTYLRNFDIWIALPCSVRMLRLLLTYWGKVLSGIK